MPIWLDTALTMRLSHSMIFSGMRFVIGMLNMQNPLLYRGSQKKKNAH